MNKFSKFFDELYGSPLVISPAGMAKYLPYLKAIAQGQILSLPEKPEIKMSFFDDLMNPVAPDQSKNIESVAIIPISGVMTRSGSWWDYGTNDIADMMNEAFNNDAIQAIVLRVDSPGGSVDSIFPLKASFLSNKKNKKKPVYGAVDSDGMSCAYYALSFCDKIFAVDNMASVGSIGVMANWLSYNEMYKDLGIELIEIVPPESKWKNRASREAMEGHPDLYIKEELTPWAIHFQETVRTNRPNLNESIEGTLEGRTFFAKYGEINAMANGLIDDIMPFDDIIEYAFNQSKNQKIKSLFNS